MASFAAESRIISKGNRMNFESKSGQLNRTRPYENTSSMHINDLKIRPRITFLFFLNNNNCVITQ